MITIDEFLERNKDCIEKGWIAYDTGWGWQWFEEKPTFVRKKYWANNGCSWSVSLAIFNIPPFEGDPKDSLIEVG